MLDNTFCCGSGPVTEHEDSDGASQEPNRMGIWMIWIKDQPSHKAAF